jgi:hypothetical protein
MVTYEHGNVWSPPVRRTQPTNSLGLWIALLAGLSPVPTALGWMTVSGAIRRSLIHPPILQNPSAEQSLRLDDDVLSLLNLDRQPEHYNSLNNVSLTNPPTRCFYHHQSTITVQTSRISTHPHAPLTF